MKARLLAAIQVVLQAVALSESRAADLLLTSSASFEGTDQTLIVPQVLTFDPRVVKLRVLAVPAETKSNDSTLSDLNGRLERRLALRKKDWAIMNGGLSSFRTDVPLGLLVVDGKALGTLSRELAYGGRAASLTSDFGKFRWSGILCQLASDDTWKIVPASIYKPGQCRQAIQSGPVLVEPGGKVGISDEEPKRSKPYIRSAVCLLADGRMRLIVAPQPTHLLPFARWLARPEPGGGCDVALNLSGDSSSGLFIHSGPTKRGSEQVGPASYPLPSALLVHSLP